MGGFVLKFRIGQKVKVLPSAKKHGVNPDAIGKVGRLIDDNPDCIVVELPFEQYWYMSIEDIALHIKIGQQLTFPFMDIS